MKTFLSYIENLLICEGRVSIFDKLQNVLFGENSSEESIKVFIKKHSIKTVLNSIGKHGAPLRNNYNLNWFQHWGISQKSETEYARGAFGRTPDNFVKNITYLFSNILHLTKGEDYTLSEPGLHRDVSSNSKLSIEVNMHFDTPIGFYEDKFYICNNQLNSDGKEIILQDKNLLPINILDKFEFKSYKGLKETIKDGLTKRIGSVENGEYVNMLILLIDNIVKSTENDKFSFDKIVNLEDKIILNYKLDERFSNLYDTLDNQSKNNICTIFGEILAGVCLINSCKPFNSLKYPASAGERFCDLYYNGLGISVKRKNHHIGHKVEVSNIAKQLLASIENTDILELLKENNIPQSTIDSFKKDITLFCELSTDEKKKSRNDIVWDLAFELFSNDNEFNDICKVLDINKTSLLNEHIILEKIDSLTEINRKDLLYKLVNFGESNITLEWVKTPTSKKEKEKNYSKVMHALQLRIVKELNRRYVNTDSESSDIFTILVSNVVNYRQAYVDIKNDSSGKDLNLTIVIENMEKIKYKFAIAGATWNEWTSHGNIGFTKK